MIEAGKRQARIDPVNELSSKAASAGVPDFLAFSTIKAASLLAAGQAATTQVNSVHVAALTEGELKHMLRTKRMSTVVADLAVFVLVVGGGAVLARTLAEDAKYVKLVHADTGKVLAVADDSDEAGAKTVLAKDDASKGQQWKLEKDGDHYKIVNRKSGKVLDVESDSKDEGGSIIQWDEKTEDNDNQRWSWEGKEKDRRLKSKSSNLVLDVGEEGAIVQRKADEKSKAQLWRVVEVKE